MVLICGLLVLGSEAVQSLTPRTSQQDRRMLVSGVWDPFATSEFKTVFESASVGVRCGTRFGGVRSCGRGCWTSMCSSPGLPTSRWRSRVATASTPRACGIRAKTPGSNPRTGTPAHDRNGKALVREILEIRSTTQLFLWLTPTGPKAPGSLSTVQQLGKHEPTNAPRQASGNSTEHYVCVSWSDNTTCFHALSQRRGIYSCACPGGFVGVA